MSDQEIRGHRSLSEEEIEAINLCKDAANRCKELISVLYSMEFVDERSVALGRDNLQTGFMWLVRSVARPGNF